jgi:hypothetical protein
LLKYEGEGKTENIHAIINKRSHVPAEPIIIGSSEDVGTMRARANHIDSVIHFYKEQVKLKALGVPIE